MRHITLLALLLLGSPIVAADSAVSFRSDIAPILLEHCLACHGAKKAEGGYRVDNYDELLKPGDSGELPIGKTKDEPSELLRRLTCDESERMPAESEPLTAEQITRFKQWIESGAVFDGEASHTPLDLVIPSRTYADPPQSYRHAIPITATAFSPDGTQIVAAGYHELTIWDPTQKKLVRRIKNVGQRVLALAFTPDGKTLAVGCGEPGKSGEVRLLDFASGEIKNVIARTTDVVLDVAFRPHSDELAVASADSMIRIYNTQSLEEIRVIASHADWVTAVAWSDDGNRLASASRDKSVKVYDGTTAELLATYLGHGAAVRGVAFLADGKQVISSGGDNKLHRWNIEGAKKVAEIGFGGEAFKLIRGDNFVLVPCADKRLLRIDLGNNTIAQEFKGHTDWVISAALKPTEAEPQVVSGSLNGEVRLWKLADGVLLQAWIAKP
ncbi:translocation protein TolB [Novipirellula galeiformis]|uniref:Translocation protein TolB n=1 Tax=Novipirellula galeiformis TaxID=2528004 RepID=A0A5C6CAC9_9BACT|nr:c-type cytochrome domain-containing protein [Novipirellula galeiformis]TWU21035.1 translocation protein TolB [Novipirellula galeiformis]